MQGLSAAIIQDLQLDSESLFFWEWHHLEDQGGLECEHEEHERQPVMTFSDLSRYPLAMMQGLSAAIIQVLGDQGGVECEHGEQERQPVMTSPDLSRYPLATSNDAGSWHCHHTRPST